jgi:hypothetical protein
MTVQREMCSVDGDPVTNQPCNSLELGADYRPQATPEQAMMNEEEVSLLLSCHPYRRSAQIDRGGYSSDAPSIPDLQTVERFGIVVYGVDSEVLVAIVNDIEEVHVRERFWWLLRIDSITTTSRHHLYIAYYIYAVGTNLKLYDTWRSVIHTAA